MIEVKRFSGIMNNDNRPDDVLQGQHISARNMRFYGGQNGLTAENVKGNILISNSSLPAGINECIGGFYDQVRKRIIWFNYNSYGNNGIYQYSIQTETISKIFICNTDSASDILNFSLDYPVHSASIVYRENVDGDLLYWTDSYNRPRYLNLGTVSTLAPFTESMINAGKNAPTRPPGSLSYLSDSSVNANYVKNKMFQFAYRWVYVNGEKSTFSPTSIVSIPVLANPNGGLAQNVNNYISFDLYAGDTADNYAIEVFARVSNGTTWGDFFQIDSLPLSQYNIPFGGTYTYNFYNNGTYIYIDPQESDLYFDWLPDIANTLETLNGNVIIYAGCTEGYPNLTRSEVDVTITASTSTGTGDDTYAWKWGCNQRFGLIYFDERGKTNGVISFITDSGVDSNDFSVTTLDYDGALVSNFGKIPKISASINHTPPSWAVAYQWVRVPLTPKFLHWVTNEMQMDTQYLYFCIQNLYDYHNTSGFIPSYEFAEGDRIKLLANWAGNAAVPITPQQDYPILGIVDRTMTSPAQTGKFIKVANLGSPSPGFTNNMFIEVYTPVTQVPDKELLFYEWGQRYAIYTSGGNRYHRGQTQDQTGSQPALFEWTNGDVYVKYRDFPATLPFTSSSTLSHLYMMDANWNDYVPTAANGNGRAWTINPSAATIYNPVLLRWGGQYQQGTDLNQLNRFRPADFDEIDRVKGDIRRLKTRDRILRVFQDRAAGQFGVYSRFIQSNDGDSNLVTTDQIITTNNINYYAGIHGLGGYPTNLCSSPNADYFVDVITGREIRLAADGFTDLGLLYKGQYTLPTYVTPYNKQLTRTNGSIAKIIKFWDSFEGEAHTILQAGTSGSTSTSDKNYSFNEIRNGFCCDDYDYVPEWALSADDIIYSWKEGYLYKHDDATNRCKFYGVNYGADITVVFNQNLLEKKTAAAISQITNNNQVWGMPLLYSNVLTYTGQRQETNLIDAEFFILEGMPSASIKRDSNSPGGKTNGQYIKGNWFVAKFRKENAQNLIILSELSLRAIDSPLTVKS